MTTATLPVSLPQVSATPESVARVLLETRPGLPPEAGRKDSGATARGSGVTRRGPSRRAWWSSPAAGSRSSSSSPRRPEPWCRHACRSSSRSGPPGSSRTATASSRSTRSRTWKVRRGSASSGPGGATRYRLDARGRIGVIERTEHQRQSVTVIEEYARATPGRASARATAHERAGSPNGRVPRSRASSRVPLPCGPRVAAGRMGDHQRVRPRASSSARGADRPPASLIGIAVSATGLATGP